MAVLLVLATVLLWNRGKALFMVKNTYYVLLPDAGGLYRGAAVFTGGVESGRISSLKFHPDWKGVVIATLRVDSDIHIPHGSDVELTEVDRIRGESALLINLVGGAGYYASGDTLLSRDLLSGKPDGQDAVERLETPSSAEIFRIQVLASAIKRKESDPVFHGVPVMAVQRNGIWKYYTGNFNSREEAVRAKDSLRARFFPDAFIISFPDDKLIRTDEKSN
ncbi:MAG: MCE family protein [Bacteroidales bacterium]|nr:MCE family protein [Bacteroidales bacterium]